MNNVSEPNLPLELTRVADAIGMSKSKFIKHCERLGVAILTTGKRQFVIPNEVDKAFRTYFIHSTYDIANAHGLNPGFVKRRAKNGSLKAEVAFLSKTGKKALISDKGVELILASAEEKRAAKAKPTPVNAKPIAVEAPAVTKEINVDALIANVKEQVIRDMESRFILVPRGNSNDLVPAALRSEYFMVKDFLEQVVGLRGNELFKHLTQFNSVLAQDYMQSRGLQPLRLEYVNHEGKKKKGCAYHRQDDLELIEQSWSRYAIYEGIEARA